MTSSCEGKNTKTQRKQDEITDTSKKSKGHWDLIEFRKNNEEEIKWTELNEH